MKDLMIEKDIHKETHEDTNEDKDIYNHILYRKDNDKDKDEQIVKNVPQHKATDHETTEPKAAQHNTTQHTTRFCYTLYRTTLAKREFDKICKQL